ncbi:MAG: hypothetical protein ACNS60_14900 [Candidatus Cyclobacteriaceae bacterium M2_1C_046]
MNEIEIEQLMCKGYFQDKPIKGNLEETHISWVIISKKYAFKIKKPIKLSFLDFSTLALRKKYCFQEVILNRRFSNIYLGVVPVCKTEAGYQIGSEDGEVIDYAVLMKRMSVAKRMDRILHEKNVSEKNISALAKIIASFHRKAKIIMTPFNLPRAKSTFNEIAEIQQVVKEELGISYCEKIEDSMRWSNKFLTKHANRFQQRIDRNYKRDVHGDLHSGNIFLYKKPILFDCIEFNKDFREIDVLYEIAFLTMDLESFGEKGLSGVFNEQYQKEFKVIETKEDAEILKYFKCLRANVRAKVHALSAGQDDIGDERSCHLKETKKYLELMKNYITRGV